MQRANINLGLIRKRDCGAFTRMDLLAIVAVIALVAVIIVAFISSSQNKSRLAQCTSNLQKVNRAVLQFSEDNQKKLPGSASGLSGEVWWWYKELVKRHVGLTGPSSTNDTLFACPNDRGYTDPKPFHQTERFDFSSYVFNGVTLPGLPNIAGWPLSSIKLPQKTLLVMEWSAHGPLSWHKSKTGKENMPFYRDAQSVVGFVDGHVSFTKIYYDGYNAAYTRDPINGYEYKFSGN